MDTICKECGIDIRSIRGLAQHVKFHGLSSKEYYDKFYRKDNEGFCKEHGNQTRWINLSKGYLKHCSLACGASERVKCGWSETRKEKWKLKFQPMTGGGRPKGSKNKKPYPKEAADKKRLTIKQYFLSHKHHWTGKTHTEDTKRKMSESALKRIEEKGIPMSYKGKYTPINKEKYNGDWTNITYRSLWERHVMKYLDTSDSVLEWSSEEVRIPYMGPDNKKHFYFPDFLVKLKKFDGQVDKVLIEVKPFKETQPPKQRKDGKRTRQVYISEMIYAKNQAKWKAARELCEDNGWKFQIITEKELGLQSSRKKNK